MPKNYKSDYQSCRSQEDDFRACLKEPRQITAWSKNSDYGYALGLYKAARVKYPSNIYIINSFISRAGRARDFAASKAAFETAAKAGLADKVTYANFITVAGKVYDFTAAQGAFEAAKKAR